MILISNCKRAKKRANYGNMATKKIQYKTTTKTTIMTTTITTETTPTATGSTPTTTKT